MEGRDFYHRPDDEKRMVVIPREEDFGTWLDAPAEGAAELVRRCPPADLRPCSGQVFKLALMGHTKPLCEERA